MKISKVLSIAFLPVLISPLFVSCGDDKPESKKAKKANQVPAANEDEVLNCLLENVDITRPECDFELRNSVSTVKQITN